jgi:hypothetical protein
MNAECGAASITALQSPDGGLLGSGFASMPIVAGALYRGWKSKSESWSGSWLRFVIHETDNLTAQNENVRVKVDTTVISQRFETNYLCPVISAELTFNPLTAVFLHHFCVRSAKHTLSKSDGIAPPPNKKKREKHKPLQGFRRSLARREQYADPM